VRHRALSCLGLHVQGRDAFLVIVGELCRLLLHVVGLFIIRQSANVIICLKRRTHTDSTAHSVRAHCWPGVRHRGALKASSDRIGANVPGLWHMTPGHMG